MNKATRLTLTATTLSAIAILFTHVVGAQRRPTAAAEGKLSGVIRRAGTGEPVGGAVVELGMAPEPRSVRTDHSGVFVFQDLPPDNYSLDVRRSGYIFKAESCPNDCGFGLRDSKTVENIVIELVPAGAIGGIVSERGGKPLALIPVNLLRAGYDVYGQRTMKSAHTIPTNDRGEYRFFDLTPGRYYLAAGSVEGVDLRETYVREYYPAERDLSRATPIDVQPGDDLIGHDFSLARQPVFRIRGRVIEAGTGMPRNVRLIVVPHEGSPFLARFKQERDGSFEVRGILSGAYTLMAIEDDPSGAKLSAGYTAVNVAEADVEDVRLVLAPGGSLSGQITVEGPGSVEKLMSILRPQLAVNAVLALANEFARPKRPTYQQTPAGAFKIDGVLPGSYRMTMGSATMGQTLIRTLPVGYYVKEARFGAVDVLENAFSFAGPDSGTLNIVVAFSKASVSGQVLNGAEKPQKNAIVVFVPDNRKYLVVGDSVTGISDEEGRFTASGLPPGDYRAFATMNQELNGYRNAEFLEQVGRYGVPIHVTEGANPVIQLKLVPDSVSGAR